MVLLWSTRALTMPRLLLNASPNPVFLHAIPSLKTPCCGGHETSPCAPRNGASCNLLALLTLPFDRSSGPATQLSCSRREFRFLMSLAVWVISIRHTLRDPSHASSEKRLPKLFWGKSSCRFYTRPLRQRQLYSSLEVTHSELLFPTQGQRPATHR